MSPPMEKIKIIRITSDKGEVVEAEWLAKAEIIHRQLRPQIDENYVEKMVAIFNGGARMCVAVKGETLLGLAVFRTFENTLSSHRFYIDDLVAAEKQRSKGVGHALIKFLVTEAKHCGCASIDLESGSQRTQAHKFYFREGFVISSFSFRKSLV